MAHKSRDHIRKYSQGKPAKSAAFSTFCALAVLVWPTATSASPITLVARASIDAITNSDIFGNQSVKPSSIPMDIGDELRFIFTYDPNVIGVPAGLCSSGGGRWDFPGSLQSAALYSDNYVAAASGADDGFFYITSGCDSNDTWSVNPARTDLTGASIEDLDLLAIAAAIFVAGSCFDHSVAPSLPAGLLDPISCAFVSPSIKINFDDRLGSSRRIEIFARDNFSLTFPSCSDLMALLATEVFQLNLQNGISNSLDAKLDAAISATDDASANNDTAAMNQLYAFIAAVEGQRGAHISDGEADALIAHANASITCLSP